MDVIQSYFAMWNEADPGRRQHLIEQAFTPDLHYVDSFLEADGPAALDASVAAVHGTYPGHTFRLSSTVDRHHDRARWGWQLVAPNGSPIADGVDFAVLAADGRLQQVTGFVEPPVTG
jgi:hypothetical protein